LVHARAIVRKGTEVTALRSVRKGTEVTALRHAY